MAPKPPTALPPTGRGRRGGADTGCWILFKDETDSTLVLELTNGRIKLNSERSLVSTGLLIGERSLCLGNYGVTSVYRVLVRSIYVVSPT